MGIYPEIQSNNQNLVIVSKGPGAIELSRESNANWDWAEFYFHPEQIKNIESKAYTPKADCVVIEPDRNLRKFGVAQKWLQSTVNWKQYKSIAILDDDIELISCTWSKIFDIFNEINVRVAQPALTKDSHWSHPITIQNPGHLWRRVSFVEVMCPIFKQDALQEYLPYFGEEKISWGLESLWSKRELELNTGLGIIDATPVRHGRPVGAGFSLKNLDIDPEGQAKEFRKRHNLNVPIHNIINRYPIKR